MLTLKGRITNVYKTPAGVDKQGNAYEGKERVQVLCDSIDRNGETRMEMIDVSVKSSARFADMIGQEAEIPISISAKSSNVYYRETA